jgi:putative transcriptional regulator
VTVHIRWRLRQVMASRDVWTAKDLRELLTRRGDLELSKQSISDLLNHQPVQVKVRTLQALCTALRCTPNELFGIDAPQEVSISDETDRQGNH